MLVAIRVRGAEDREAERRSPKSSTAPSKKDRNFADRSLKRRPDPPGPKRNGPACGRPTVTTAIWLILPVAYASLKDEGMHVSVRTECKVKLRTAH